jgi:carboxyl-terminal processing protease
MTSPVKVGVVFSSMLLTILLVIGAVLGQSQEPNRDSAYRPLSVYTEVLAHIKSDYVEEPDIQKVTHGALQGLVEYLDPISSYLTEEQVAQHDAAQKNPDHGTGLSTGLIVQKRGSVAAILSVIPGSAGYRAGLRSGDLIEAIDDISTRMLPPAMLVSELSGQPGSTTRLLVRTAKAYDEPQEFNLTREEVKLPNVASRMLEGGVGYVDMNVVVDADRVKQTAEAVRGLLRQGASKIVLDLRENAFGDHAAGFELADLFLTSGDLGSAKGQRYPEKKFEANAEGVEGDFGLAVIVDSRTAGAAEVAASVLHDRERAELIGEQTYGIGALQQTITLDDGAELILSVAKYYRPNGETVHGKGLEPENAVAPADLRKWRDPESMNDADREDPFLTKALSVLAGA